MKKRNVQETLRRLAGHLVVETDEQRRNVDRALQGPRRGGCARRRASRDPERFLHRQGGFLLRRHHPEATPRRTQRACAQDRDTRGRTAIARLRARGPNPRVFAARLGAELGSGGSRRPISRPLRQQRWPPLLVRFLSCGEADRLVRAGDRRAGVALQVWAREGGHRFQTRQGKRVDQCALPDHGRTRGLVRRFDHCRRPDCGERDSCDPERTADGSRQRDSVGAARTRPSPVTNADPASPYGADARDLQLELPRQLRLPLFATGSRDRRGWRCRAGNSTGRSCSSRDVPTTPPRTTPSSSECSCLLPPQRKRSGFAVLDPSSISSEVQRISSEAPGRSRSLRSTSRSRPRRRARAPCWSRRTRGWSTRGRGCRVAP